MSLPSQESQSELNQCPNLAAMVHNVETTPLAISPDDLTQRSLNSQFHPDVEVETGSVARNGDLSLILTSKTDMPRPGGGNANELPQQFDSSDQPLNSLADNLTADQLVNSHGNVETGVRCSEPNQSHLDHEERPSDQASNGRKQRGRKPRVIPVEKSKNQLDQAGTSAKAGNGQKRRSRKPIIRTEEQENERKKIKKEIDRRHRRGKKNELTELRKLEQDLDRVMTIASGFGRIDQMVSQINRISCELQKVQQEEVGNGMFLQKIIDSADRVPPIRANEVQVYAWSDKCKEMEAECHRFHLMKSKYGKIEEVESMLDKFKNLEAESHRLKLMKSKYGEIEEIESRLDKFKNLEAEFNKLELMKSNYREIEEIESMLDKFKNLEAEFNRLELMKSMYGEIEENESMLDKFKNLETKSRRLELIKSKYEEIEEIESMLDKFKNLEAEFNRLELMKSKYGEIEEIESMLNKFKSLKTKSYRLELMKSKYGEIEEIESMLDKFKNLEAESHRFEQIKLLFGGVDEIESEIIRLKETELQLDKYKQMEENRKEMEFMLDTFHRMEAKLQRFEQIKSEFGGIDEIKAGMYRLKKIESQRDQLKELQFFTESPGSLQGHHGTQSSDLDRVNGTHSWLLTEVSNDEINLRLPAAVRGANTMHDMQYSDASVTKFMAKLDDDKAMSNVDLSSFKDLDGECEKVGNYNIPLCLVSTAQDIIKAKDDITKQSRFGQCVIEPAYILLCAAIKEMMDLPLEQATEEIMLKWRDAINDAKGLRFETEFAMEYMRKFARGYFGLKAKNDRESLELGMTILKTEEEVLKMELEKKTNEMKVLKAKEKDLTSEQCKDCQKFADQFFKKSVSVF
ncbi:Fiber protein Fb17 [Theobroma cacao]|uniref:Fiber protein Fb17 n=1 Tax=Theobroma cacao TaxID=3641 RepID=A0A061GZV1_THECC|nr:Fiber protein Fb17 [Theobroma cacao]